MAQCEELPIFRAAYDLLEKLVDLSKDLPKFFRYSMGTRMVDLCLDMLGLIYRANMSQQSRAQVIDDVQINQRQLLMLLRVVYRQKAISSGRYAELIQLLDSIGKQSTGWKKTKEVVEVKSHQ